MGLAASFRTSKVSVIELTTSVVTAAIVSVTSSSAASFAVHEQMSKTALSHPIRRIFSTDDTFSALNTNAIYKKALEYMVGHPPRAYGHGVKAEAENTHLAGENRRLYEDMNHLELVMNYLAATCSDRHPEHDAICDGRAMLRLHLIQQHRRFLKGF